MTTWISSDLHYFHKNILDYCQATRPFADVASMNTHLLAHHNSNVSNEDTFIHLGDFAFGKGANFNSIVDILRQMNGTKQLILGNHDPHLIKLSTDTMLMQELGVDWIQHYHQGVHNHNHFTLCHYPMHNWYRDRYGAVMLYGHLHEKFVDTPQTWNCGWDANHATYTTLDYVINRALESFSNQREKH